MDIESLRSAASSLPPLTNFAIGMEVILVVQPWRAASASLRRGAAADALRGSRGGPGALPAAAEPLARLRAPDDADPVAAGHRGRSRARLLDHPWVGATALSDTPSLVVFAICIPAFEGNLSVSALALQIVGIVAFVPLILSAWGGSRRTCSSG
jgi:hypothetical protein